MSNFLKNGIFTTYGLSKLNNVIYGNSNFNFTTVKIGDGNGGSITLNESATDLLNPQYNLNIQDIIYGNDTITFIVAVPADLTDYTMREVGIYETVGGIEYLVGISSANVYKPAGLSYLLLIEIHYNVNVNNISPDLISLGLNSVILATPDELVSVGYCFFDIVKFNLMRTINKNYIGLTGDILPDMIPEEVPNNNGNQGGTGNSTVFSTWDDVLDFDSLDDVDYLTIGNAYINIYGTTLIKDVADNLQTFKYNLQNLDNSKNFSNLANSLGVSNIMLSYYFNNQTQLPNYEVIDQANKNNNLIVNTDKSFILESPNIKLANNSGDLPFTIMLDLKFNNLQDQIFLKSGEFFELSLLNSNLMFKIIDSTGLGYISVVAELDYTYLNKNNSFSFTYNGDKNNPITNIYYNKINKSADIVNNNYIGLSNSNINSLINYNALSDLTLLSSACYNNINIIAGELTPNKLNYITNTTLNL